MPFTWDLLDALIAIKSAWAKVTQTTIANVYRRVGFVRPVPAEEAVQPEALDEPVEQVEFRNIWDRMNEIFPVPAVEDYINFDDDYPECREQLTDEQIVDTVQSSLPDAEEEDSDMQEEEIRSTPTLKDAFSALDTIRRYIVSVEAFQAGSKLLSTLSK